MKLEATLDEIKWAAYVCLRCRECTYGDWPENYPLCPIHRYHRVYTASAGGLICLMGALSRFRLIFSTAFSTIYSFWIFALKIYFVLFTVNICSFRLLKCCRFVIACQKNLIETAINVSISHGDMMFSRVTSACV